MIGSIAHKITAYVLVFILFAQNINTLVIIADFVVNQATIAKNYCVQKENQQGCNGKCHLSQQIKKSNPDGDTELPTQELRRMSLDAFCSFDIDFDDTFTPSFLIEAKHQFFYTYSVWPCYLEVETRPPSFI